MPGYEACRAGASWWIPLDTYHPLCSPQGKGGCSSHSPLQHEAKGAGSTAVSIRVGGEHAHLCAQGPKGAISRARVPAHTLVTQHACSVHRHPDVKVTTRSFRRACAWPTRTLHSRGTGPTSGNSRPLLNPTLVSTEPQEYSYCCQIRSQD